MTYPLATFKYLSWGEVFSRKNQVGLAKLNGAAAFPTIHDKMNHFVERETERGYSGLSDELFAFFAFTIVSCHTR
jgi:hypothetical protein